MNLRQEEQKTERRNAEDSEASSRQFRTSTSSWQMRKRIESCPNLASFGAFVAPWQAPVFITAMVRAYPGSATVCSTSMLSGEPWTDLQALDDHRVDMWAQGGLCITRWPSRQGTAKVRSCKRRHPRIRRPARSAGSAPGQILVLWGRGLNLIFVSALAIRKSANFGLPRVWLTPDP